MPKNTASKAGSDKSLKADTMNIILLTREYKHPELPECGGTGSFMAELARGLVRKGHAVNVVVVNKARRALVDQGVAVYSFAHLFRRNFIFNFLRSIGQKIRFLRPLHNRMHEYEKKDIARLVTAFIKKEKLQVDLIETHDFGGLYLYLDGSIPYVVRCHGSFSVLEKYFGYKNIEPGKIHCEKKAVKRARHLIAVSAFSETANRELFGISKFRRIHNGVDTALFRPGASGTTIPESIFYVGNISREKGAETALNAFLKVIETAPGASLHFIGSETPYQAEIIDLARKKELAGKIHFHGFLGSEAMIKMLAGAAVAVFPSKGENFGLALCECMALEKPVVVSGIEAFTEIVTDGMDGCIARSDREFADKILWLFNHPQQALQLGSHARQTITGRFSSEKMLEETLAYYREITAGY